MRRRLVPLLCAAVASAVAAAAAARRPYGPPFLGAVELNIVARHHIVLIVGNPGRYVLLRPNVRIDHTLLYAMDAHEAASHTYARNTDIFYIGPYKLRMPVVGTRSSATLSALDDAVANATADVAATPTPDFGGQLSGGDAAPDTEEALLRDAERVFGGTDDDNDENDEDGDRGGAAPSVDVIDDDDDDVRLIYTEYVTDVLGGGGGDGSATSAEAQQQRRQRWQAIFAAASAGDADGEFALGPGAAIWRYWANFTLSADSLTLGGVDRYLQRDVRHRAATVPVLFYYPLYTDGVVAAANGAPARAGGARGPAASVLDAHGTSSGVALTGNAATAHKFLAASGRGGGAHGRHAIIEQILSQRYASALPHEYAPRGAPIVLGRVAGRLYKIVIDHAGAATYIPRHLHRLDSFDIVLGELQHLAAGGSAQWPPQRTNNRHGRALRARHLRVADDAAQAITVLHFSLADHRVSIGGGGGGVSSGRSVVRESPLDDVIVFGAHTLRHLVVFFDALHMRLSLAPSYAAPVASQAQALAVYCASLLVAATLALWWLVSANARVLWLLGGERAAAALAIVAMLQLAGSLQCAACAVVLCFGYDVGRYVAHYARTEHGTLYASLLCGGVLALCALSAALAVLTLARVVAWHATRQRAGATGAAAAAAAADREARLVVAVRRWIDTGSVRRFAFESAALVVLWLCAVPRHQTFVDTLYLLLVASALAATSTLSALDARYHRRPHAVVVALGSALAYAFLYAHNLLPMSTFVWGSRSAYRHSLSAVYAVALVFAPCVYLYSLYRKRLFVAHLARYRERTRL